jgi:hypothetical protein
LKVAIRPSHASAAGTPPEDVPGSPDDSTVATLIVAWIR